MLSIIYARVKLCETAGYFFKWVALKEFNDWNISVHVVHPYSSIDTTAVWYLKETAFTETTGEM